MTGEWEQALSIVDGQIRLILNGKKPRWEDLAKCTFLGNVPPPCFKKRSLDFWLIISPPSEKETALKRSLCKAAKVKWHLKLKERIAFFWNHLWNEPMHLFVLSKTASFTEHETGNLVQGSLRKGKLKLINKEIKVYS